MGKQLNIFTAGVVRSFTAQAVEQWNHTHPDFPAVFCAGGSVNLVRKCLNGDPCDLLILADDFIIESMMMPAHTDGYYIFAGNRMVLVASPGCEISDTDWKEKLLDPKTRFSHHNPYVDPGGYRAVMAILLADQYEKGLTEKLMNHPGHIGMDPSPAPEEPPKFDYEFYYYTAAKQMGGSIAELPAVMNLGDESFADVYATVSFAVDEKNTVTGTPISHALTIPFTADHPKEAREFANIFLQSDFVSKGFISKSKAVGNWK